MVRISRKWKIVGLVAVIAGLYIWPMTASTRGRFAARRDLAKGHYVVLGYGLPVQSRGEYARLLHERYGIEFRAVAGCIVSQSLIEYVDGYDRVMVDAAKKKFGRDVFKESSEEAERIVKYVR